MAEVARTSEQGSGGSPPPDDSSPPDNGWRKEYWRRNLRLMVILLSIWFVVSFGCGILFVDQLNKIVINDFPLGFWFAQQGSIYTFVLLILAYAVLMDRLDDRFGVSERDGDGRRT
jgi:putative solute:sodium symporter small subunit